MVFGSPSAAFVHFQIVAAFGTIKIDERHIYLQFAVQSTTFGAEMASCRVRSRQQPDMMDGQQEGHVHSVEQHVHADGHP